MKIKFVVELNLRVPAELSTQIAYHMSYADLETNQEISEISRLGFHWLDEEPVSSISPIYFDGRKFTYKKGWGWAGFWVSKVWITDSPDDGSKRESRCINQNDSNLHMNSAPIVSPVAVISNTFESLNRVKFNLSSPKTVGSSELVVAP